MTRNDQTEEKLTPKQEDFITSLLTQPSIAAAAREIDLPDKTARRWLKLDHFQQAYQQAKQDRFTNALDMLQSGIGTAMETLHKHMTSDETPPAVQLRAAQLWLEQAIKSHEMNEMEQKIAALEEIVQERHR